MMTAFDRLEKEKTALISPSGSQIETLHYIRSGIEELLPSVDIMASREAKFVDEKGKDRHEDMQKVSRNCRRTFKSHLTFDPNQTTLDDKQTMEK